MASTYRPARGTLVSIEGLSGVGKTYLTTQLVHAAPPSERPHVVEEFSQRIGGDNLGRNLLHILVTASGGERFLRAGYPSSETLLLLAIKMHDFEATRPDLRTGRTVIEGRSIHSVAAYQSLILHPDDDHAAAELAQEILDTAARWRPLPDLTVVISDDPETAVKRAETRDAITYTEEQWRLHYRAAVLFGRFAATDPDHVRLIDRRNNDADTIVATIQGWIATAPHRQWPTRLGPAVDE